MAIRGAPQSGRAAMGVALGVKAAAANWKVWTAIRADLQRDRVRSSYAVNLFWAVERMQRVYREYRRKD
jgi:methylthioribose-1-phosphate isomerase